MTVEELLERLVLFPKDHEVVITNETNLDPMGIKEETLAVRGVFSITTVKDGVIETTVVIQADNP